MTAAHAAGYSEQRSLSHTPRVSEHFRSPSGNQWQSRLVPSSQVEELTAWVKELLCLAMWKNLRF